MATGRLGSADLSATTNTAVYGPVAASTFSVVTVNILNRNPASTVNIRLAISTSASSPANAEWLEYDTTLAAKGVLERTGLVLDEANKYIIVYASGTGVSVNVYGIETTTV
jgi:hypothetical protein